MLSKSLIQFSVDGGGCIPSLLFTWNPLQYSCLGNSMDIESWWEKAMATHYSTLAWKIPWMEEPGRLQSIGSLRVGHN